MSLKKDTRWDAWQINSEAKFAAFLPQIDFVPSVSDDITKRFEIVKNLLLHSYYQYDFLDVAFRETLPTFELALRERYMDLEKDPKQNPNLAELIQWGTRQQLFGDDIPIADTLRHLRNWSMHPKEYSLAGITILQIIPRIAGMINTMYDRAVQVHP